MYKDTIKNPEMRQFQLSRTYFDDNCRPSGLLYDSRVDINPIEKRRLFVIKTNTNITLDSGVLKRWVVLSSGRRPVLIRYLFLKLVYDELTKQEYQLLLSFHESTTLKSIFFALKARKLKIHKKVIRKILEAVKLDQKFDRPTRDEYIGLKQIKFSIESRTDPPIKKPKPYSGYSKGYKDGQRKSKFQIDEFSSSPLEPSPLFEDEIKILLDFTVEISRHPRQINWYLNLLKGNDDELE